MRPTPTLALALLPRTFAAAGPACPHCSKPIDEHVTRAELDRKVAAKDAEITTLREATALAAEHAKAAKKLPAVEAELAALRSSVEQRDAFDAAGIPSPLRAGFAAIYASEVASAEEGKAPTVKDWLALETTKSHPLLAPHFVAASGESEGAGQGAAGTQGAVGTQGQSATGTGQGAKGAAGTQGQGQGVKPPNTEGGVQRAPKGPEIRNRDELRAYFASQEYRAMKPEDQRARRAELETSLTRGAQAR